MSDATLSCTNEQRRNKIRERKEENYNGLDYLEYHEDEQGNPYLKVFFLNKAPEGLTEDHIVIEGGRRKGYKDIKVTSLKFCRQQRQDLDDCLIVYLDKSGDFSTYKLCLIELDGYGLPTGNPFPGFDPRYACLEFSFKVDCPQEIDCADEPICPPEVYPEPEINYLARDYASFRQLILDRLALTMPDWRERHVPDIGITLVELMAYVGDRFSYYQDAVATEAYLDTARQRISVRRHARLVDYQMHEGCNARTWLQLANDGADYPAENPLDLNDLAFLTNLRQVAPQLERQLLWADVDHKVAPKLYEVFEPLYPADEISLYQAHNEIQLYTWGDKDCCFAKGATSATFIDGSFVERPLPHEEDCDPEDIEYETVAERVLNLKVGDVIVFEELLSPETGLAADADPTHRHAVRLTHVEQAVDDLYNQPILEVAWSAADALPFSLCISTLGPPPYCEEIGNISVARGNILLVDHGRSQRCEFLGTVPTLETAVSCKGIEQPTDITLFAGKFRPKLEKSGITYTQPLPNDDPESGQFASARELLQQNPKKALPAIDLKSGIDLNCTPPAIASENEDQPSDDCNDDLNEQTETVDYETALIQTWLPNLDLLDCYFDDPHFVAEIDNFGFAHLRFGDGELGMLPRAGDGFTAVYRTGNSDTGNIGAESIYHLVSHKSRGELQITPRNLLSAVGGTQSESIAEVKLFAPHAFRQRLERAIIPQDYADIVMREFKDKVQRATADMRWTGSYDEIMVAVDQRGQEKASPALLAEIEQTVEQYRRIGHSLAVKPAQLVSLHIEMLVCVKRGYLQAHVRKAIQDKLGNRQLSDGSLGFFHPDNLTFGEGIHLSKLIAITQSVAGVESVAVEKFQRQYEDENGELDAGILKLGPLEVARVDNNPNFPDHGLLIIRMEGGR